jgi:Ca-activated chloride channel homolog
MSFQWPLVLLGLLAVPVLLALYVLAQRRRASDAARFANPSLLSNLVSESPRWRRHLPFAVLLVALAALIVGVARPHATVTVQHEEATVILDIDVSRSMAATDVRPTRLQAARAGAEAFLDKVPAKFRVAIVTFASRAVVALAPTTDRSLARKVLATLEPGQGTALGDAVELSARLARRERGNNGSVLPASVLLISDGTQDGGRFAPAAGAERAKAEGMPVYTVLVGTDGGVVEQTLPGGLRAIVQVPPSPDTLEQLAEATGGEFFTATNDARLKDVYERLGSRLGHEKKPLEITDLFAAGAAGLLLVGGGLSTAWFRRVA